MKVLVRKPQRKVRVRVTDRMRSKSLSQALIRASEKKRRKELAERGKSNLKKPEKSVNVTVLPKKPDETKTTVRITGVPLNKNGNLRGMHNAENSDQMRKIRAMRKIYNKQMPVPQCNTCAYSQQCPKYRAGFECAFLPFLGSHNVDTPTDLLEYMKDLIGANFRRAQMATALETLSGGAPSLELSESLMMLFNMTRDLAEYMREEEDRNGSMDIETNDRSVIKRLFGDMDNLLGNTKAALDNPLDTTPVGSTDEEYHDKLGDGFENVADEVDSEIMGDFDKMELAKIEKKNKKKKAEGKVSNAVLCSVLKKAA